MRVRKKMRGKERGSELGKEKNVEEQNCEKHKHKREREWSRLKKAKEPPQKDVFFSFLLCFPLTASSVGLLSPNNWL